MLPGLSRGEPTIILATLTVNEKGSKELILLRVKPTPTRLPANIRHTPVDSPVLLWLPCMVAII